MSAILGPIHTWLYKKIVFQNHMIDSIEKLAIQKNWMDENINMNRYDSLEQGNLEDIVDSSDIHGWLQDRVSLVESKLAYLVTMLVDAHPDRAQIIYESVRVLGNEYRNDALYNPKMTFDYLDTLLLNGMPCDRVNVIVENTDDRLVWQQTKEIHKSYWDMVGGDVKHFYSIRMCFIEGLLENSKYSIKRVNETLFEITTRDF